MDEKLESLLMQILDRQNGTNTRLDKIENRLDKIENRLDSLEVEVKKNSILLESVETKVKTLSEIQNSYMNSNVKDRNEIIVPIKESIDTIELAVTKTSKDVQELSCKFDKVEKVTIQNTYDVAYLKSVK